MKPLEAPVWVRSHDLARWILERVAGFSPQARDVVGHALATEARGLVLSVSLALTFLGERPEHVRDADRAIVRVRELLRLAHDLGFLPASSHRYAQGELLEIGRMVGGWRKRWGLPGPTRGEREETGHGRCRPRRARRELEERSEEVPVRVPEQEAPGGQERQPGLPRPGPPRPQPDGLEEQGEGVPT